LLDIMCFIFQAPSFLFREPMAIAWEAFALPHIRLRLQQFLAVLIGDNNA